MRYGNIFEAHRLSLRNITNNYVVTVHRTGAVNDAGSVSRRFLSWLSDHCTATSGDGFALDQVLQRRLGCS